MKKYIILLAFSFILLSCTNASHEDLHDHEEENPNPTTITYTDDIASIMSSNCTSCHGNPPTQNAPFSLTTYNQVQSRINSIISRINNASNPMPTTGLMPQATRDLIQQWKDDGLLEN